MKIGIIGFANLRYMPYLEIYRDLLRKYNLSYETIFWDREGLNESVQQEMVFVFKKRLSSSIKLVKLPLMIKFAKFSVNIIKFKKYDRLIILTTLPGVMMGNFLMEKYNGRYLLDIRDYTYEKYFLYKKYLAKLIRSAGMRVISSPGFKTFLPADDYIICHNFRLKLKSNREIRSNKPRKKDTINIIYPGLLSYFNEVKSFLNVIANDKRFYMYFYGRGPDEAKLREYCVKNKILNAIFYGPYDPDEKERFYAEADLIYAAYGNNTISKRCLLANKLYDAAWYKIPILVSVGTEMAISANSLGYKLNLSKEVLADDLYEWYNHQIDWQQFETSANNFIEKVIEENNMFEKKLLDFLLN